MATGNQPRRMTIRKQIEQKTNDIREGASWNKLPRIAIYDKEYIANVWLQTAASSSILEHGDYLIPIETEVKDGVRREKKGIKIWLCHHCDKLGRIKIFNGTSTNGPKAHLETKGESGHDLVVGRRGDNSIIPSPRESPDDDEFIYDLEPQEQAEKGKRILLRLIVKHDIPLDTLTQEAFKTLTCCIAGERAGRLFPDSISTAQSWVRDAFESGRAIIKQQLREEARSKIHLSFHTWLSQKNKSVLAVAAHFVDQNWKPRARLIGLKKINGAYTPENIAPGLISVIEEYGIHDQLGFYVANHHTRNDRVLCLLLQHYDSDLTKHDAMKLVDQVHVRSCDHLINTAATNFVYEIKDNEKDRSIAIPSVRNSYRTNYFIRETPERRNDFFEFAEEVYAIEILGRDFHRVLREFVNEDDKVFDVFTLTNSSDMGGGDLPNLYSRGVWDIGEGKLGVRNSKLAKVEGDTCWNGVLRGAQSTLILRESIVRFTNKYQPEMSERISPCDWVCLSHVKYMLSVFDHYMIQYSDNVVDLPMVMALVYELKQLFGEFSWRFHHWNPPVDLETEPGDYYFTPTSPPTSPATSPATSQSSLRTPIQRGMKRKKSADEPHEEVAIDLDTQQRKKTRTEMNTNLPEQYRDNIHEACERVNDVLDEYWDMSMRMPVYWAAIVLDPGKRLERVRTLNPKLAEDVKGKIIAYWRSHYVDPTTLTDTSSEAAAKSPQPHGSRAFAWLSRFDRTKSFGSGAEGDGLSRYDNFDSDMEDEDEFERYLSMEKTGFKRGQEPLLWWRDHQTEFPRLHQFAFDILSVPGTSIKCKRILKQSGPTMCEFQQAICEPQEIRSNIREMTQCLKYWLEEVET